MSAAVGAFVLGGLKMGLNVFGQTQAIEQAEEYNEALWESEVINGTYENRARNMKQAQTEEQIQQQKRQVKLQALEKQGEARARGGASGLSGRSINQMSAKFQEQAAQALSTLNNDMQNSRAAYTMDTKASQQSVNSRIESNWKSPEFSWASVASAAIQGGQQGAQMGSNLKIGQNNGTGSPGTKGA